MSLSNMLTAATLPTSDPSSLFVDPSAPGRGELQSIKTALENMYAASPSYDPLNPIDLTCVDDLCNNMSSHISTKISSIGTQLPLMNAASSTDRRVANIDAVLADQPPPPAPPDCDSLMSAAFQTIKEIGTFIGGVASAIYDMFSALLTPLFGVVGDIIGSVVTTVKEVFAAIVGPFGGAVSSAIGGALTGFLAIISDITTAVTNAITAFAGMMANEAAVIAAAINRLLNFSFINSLNTTDPCNQSIHGTIINQSNVDPAALAALLTA